MKKCLVNVVFVLVSLFCYSQTASILPKSYFAGGVSVAQKGDWQGFDNPALLAVRERCGLSLVYENRFAMKELSTQELSFSLPTSLINIGVAVSRFGYSSYSEKFAGISFARTFDELFSMGIQFNYYTVAFSRSLGSKGIVMPQIGLFSEVTPEFYLGLNVFNPMHQQLRYQELVKDLPCLFTIGMQYRMAESFRWLLQFDKEISSRLIVRSGFEYYLTPSIVVKVGGYGAPLSPTLGCGVTVGGFVFDVNFERHPVLGITSVGALRCNF
jgi:hypothetical protein